MNIWYLNHYATPPEYGIPGRAYYLARNMAMHGHQVVNICANNHHLRREGAPEQDLNNCKEYGGVKYFHVPTRVYDGNGVGRLLNMIDYARSVARLMAEVKAGNIPQPDILIPSCVHPFAFPACLKLAKKIRAKLIYEVRDIWPLSLIELSGVSRWHPLVWWLSRIEKQAYRNADAVISLLPQALDHMQPLGLDPERFYCVPNGICLQEWETLYEPLPDTHRQVFQQLKKAKKLIVVYAGAHGPPNALDQILDLSKINKNTNVPYHFVLIGDGVEKKKLVKRAQDQKNSFVTFLPKITKYQVIGALKQADVCFIGLKPSPVFRFGVSPNKLGDYLMAGKPIIYAVDAGNDRVQEAGAGISVSPYKSQQLNAALNKLLHTSFEDRLRIGENGRKYAQKFLDWKVLGRDYAKICESLVAGRRQC